LRKNRKAFKPESGKANSENMKSLKVTNQISEWTKENELSIYFDEKYEGGDEDVF